MKKFFPHRKFYASLCRSYSRNISLFFLISFLLGGFQVFAQQQVTGRVTSAGNSAIPGVTVTVKETSVSSLTNDNGQFTIVAPPASTLVISHIGYNTVEIPVNSRSVVNIQLSETS